MSGVFVVMEQRDGRMGRSVRLTEAGRVFIPHARAILEQMDSARSSVAAKNADLCGSVAVGVILAELLGVPHATLILTVEVEGTKLKVKRELEEGWFQQIEMPTPAATIPKRLLNWPLSKAIFGVMRACTQAPMLRSRKQWPSRSITNSSPRRSLSASVFADARG